MTNYSQYKPETFEYNGKWIRNWFSNLEPCPIAVDGKIWPSVENYYQAHKTLDLQKREIFLAITPSKAKYMGKTLIIRPDWEQVKYSVMMKALEAKFSQQYWKEKLLATGDEPIIEWNNWSDRIWGVDVRDCKGQNLLGKALMEIRTKLKGGIIDFDVTKMYPWHLLGEIK